MSKRFLGAVVACLVLTLQACGGGGSSGSGPSGSSPLPESDPPQSTSPELPPTDSGPLPPTNPVPPEHTDRVLDDLIDRGRYTGDYSAGQSYAIGDVTLYGQSIYFCYADTDASGNSPSEDSAHFDLLPLVDGETFAVDDHFDYSPGPLRGRETVEGFVWGTTGTGYLNAYVDPNGFLTSSENTYYLLRYLPGPITEFGTVQSTASPLLSRVATMTISPNNLENNFAEMWHVNWFDNGVGQSLYWHDGAVAVPATYKFKYNAGLVYAPGSPHELVLKIRGKFLFGYLDGQLAFIELADMFETLTAGANAVYTQNHSASAENEKVYRVWVKVKSP